MRRFTNGFMAMFVTGAALLASPTISLAIDADTVDGKHAAELADVNHGHDGLYQEMFANRTVVAQSGGEYSDPVAAVSGLASWCGTPSAGNPCLIEIMPGVYDIGSETVNLPAYVALKGAGPSVSIITKILTGTGSVIKGSTSGYNWISDLSVEGSSSSVGSVKIVSLGDNSSLSNATVNANGTGYTTFTGVGVGAGGELDHVKVNVSARSAYGIRAGSGTTVRDVTVNVNATGTSGYYADGLTGEFRSVKDTSVTVTSSSMARGVLVSSYDSIVEFDGLTVSAIGTQGGAGLISFNAKELRLTNCSISGNSGGVSVANNPGADEASRRKVYITNSEISGGSKSLNVQYRSDETIYDSVIYMANTKVNGQINMERPEPEMQLTCFNTYDAAYQPLICP